MTFDAKSQLDALELEDDWQTLRRPRASPKEAPATVATSSSDDVHQLESDWATLRNLPEHVYLVRGDVMTSSFALWRLVVSGQKKVRRGPREVDCWIATKEKLLFEWGLQGRLDDFKTAYSIAKHDCDLTFEAAAERFKRFQATHLKRLQLEIRYQEEQVRAHLAEIRGIKERILSLAKVELTSESIERDGLRKNLLSVLGQRAARLRMVQELEEMTTKWIEADVYREFDEY